MLSNPVAPKTKPSGNTGEIQFNNNGAFSSSASLFWDTANNKLRLGAITFPNTDGLENQVLGTDGSGNLRWQNATADHGALSGLSDDDHPQYLNNARGDARYYLQSQVDTSLALKTNISDIVNNLTSTATNVPLSAAQGKALKDLIDTINSLLSSDELTLDTLQEIVDYIQINRTDLENLNIAAIAGLQAALDAKAVAHGSDGYIQFKSGSNLSSSANLFWDNVNNRLGVGTNSPNNPLHFLTNSAATTYSTITAPVIKIENTNSGVDTYSALHLRANTADTFIANVYKGANLADLVFLVDSASGVQERLRIDSDGNISFGGWIGKDANSNFTPDSGTNYYFNSAGAINFNIDTNNNETNRFVGVRKNGVNSAGTLFFRLYEDGVIDVNETGTEAMLNLAAGSATKKGILVKAAASQSANLLELQNSAGTTNSYFDANGGLVVNESGQSINPFRVETSSNTHSIYVSNVGGRVGINTSSVSSSLNIGGDRIITFAGGAGNIFNVDSLRTTSAGAARLTVTCGELYLGGGVGSSKLSIVPQSINHVPLGLKQVTGGTTTMLQIQNDSGVQTMGLTTTGLTQAGSGNGMARFDIQHTVAPSSADGDGVGLNFRTENASGSLADIAYIDAVYDDISEDDVSMKFYIRNSGAPNERLRLNSDGTLTVNASYTLPSSDGPANYVLSTDGLGNVSWVAQSGGGGTPGGADTQIQFNDSGSFAGSSFLTFDGSTLSTPDLNVDGVLSLDNGSSESKIIYDSPVINGQQSGQRFVIEPTSGTAQVDIRPAVGSTDQTAIVLQNTNAAASGSHAFAAGLGLYTLQANVWHLAATVNQQISANSFPIAFSVSDTVQGRFEALRIHNSGNIGIGVTNPSAQLQAHVYSSSKIGFIIRGAASQSASLQEWQDSAGNSLSVIDSSGNLGIGTSAPAKPLHVFGDLNGAIARIQANSTISTWYSTLEFAVSTNINAVANARIQGTRTGELRLAPTSHITIGAASTSSVPGFKANSTKVEFILGDDSARTGILAGASEFTSVSSSDVGLVIKGAAGQTANILEIQNDSSTLLTQIDSAGNIKSNQDIEITDSSKGAILKSPDGTRWRITVGDDGSLKATSL